MGVPLENRETAEYEYEVIQDEWEKIRPFLAQRSDLGKAKSSRTKRKFSLEELETSASEGPSNSRCKRDRMSCDNEPLDKSWGQVEEAKRLTEKMDVKLPSPGPSEGDSGPVPGSPVHSKKAVTVPQKDERLQSCRVMDWLENAEEISSRYNEIKGQSAGEADCSSKCEAEAQEV